MNELVDWRLESIGMWLADRSIGIWFGLKSSSNDMLVGRHSLVAISDSVRDPARTADADDGTRCDGSSCGVTNSPGVSEATRMAPSGRLPHPRFSISGVGSSSYHSLSAGRYNDAMSHSAVS